MATASTLNPLSRLLEGNKKFATHLRTNHAELLAQHAQGQSPETLWLGCSDSRIPETTVCDCKPGDMFVHRNIGSVVRGADTSAAAVIAFAVGVVKVSNIVLCGHTRCGAALAALGDADLGEELNGWLAPVRELRRKHKAELEGLDGVDAKATRLAELNVLAGLEALRGNAVVQRAVRERGVTLHGVIYDIPRAEVYELEEAGLKTSSGATHHR